MDITIGIDILNASFFIGIVSISLDKSPMEVSPLKNMTAYYDSHTLI